MNSRTVIVMFAAAVLAIAQSFNTPSPPPIVNLVGYEAGAEDAAAALTTANLTSHAIVVNASRPKVLTEASCISDAGDQSITIKIGATTLFLIHCVAPGAYSAATTNGTTGYIIAASMTTTAVAAHAQLNLSGTANGTTKDVKVFIYGR